MLAALQGRLRTLFTASTPMRAAWAAAEDEKLRAMHAKYGASWNLLSFHLPSRSARECRQRWLKLSGMLKDLSPQDRHRVYDEGWDPTPSGKLVRLPEGKVRRSPYALLVEELPKVPQRITGRRPWSETERFAVLMGHEQFGPNWTKIAQRIPGRTPRQCQMLMEQIYADYPRIRKMPEDPELFLPKERDDAFEVKKFLKK